MAGESRLSLRIQTSCSLASGPSFRAWPTRRAAASPPSGLQRAEGLMPRPAWRCLLPCPRPQVLLSAPGPARVGPPQAPPPRVPCLPLCAQPSPRLPAPCLGWATRAHVPSGGGRGGQSVGAGGAHAQSPQGTRPGWHCPCDHSKSPSEAQAARFEELASCTLAHQACGHGGDGAGGGSWFSPVRRHTCGRSERDGWGRSGALGCGSDQHGRRGGRGRAVGFWACFQAESAGLADGLGGAVVGSGVRATLRGHV